MKKAKNKGDGAGMKYFIEVTSLRSHMAAYLGLILYARSKIRAHLEQIGSDFFGIR